MKLDCILFSYAQYKDLPQWVKDMDNNPNDFCRLVIIYQGFYAHFAKHLDPVFLKLAGYDYVVLNMDDVQLYGPEATYEFESFFRFVLKYKLAVASPAIVGETKMNIAAGQGEPHHVGRTVDTIEIQSTTFRLDAWECFWAVADTEFLSGWYDDYLHYYCQQQGRIKENNLFGIMNNQKIVHVQPNRASTNNPPKGPWELYNEQREYWKKHRNITLGPWLRREITGYLD
jgi:hypothetical protein